MRNVASSPFALAPMPIFQDTFQFRSPSLCYSVEQTLKSVLDTHWNIVQGHLKPSRQVCRKSKYRSVHFTNNNQCRINLHGTTSKSNANKNGPAGLRDCKCATTCTEEESRWQFLNLNRKRHPRGVFWTRCDLSGTIVLLNQYAIRLPERRAREQEKSVTETIQPSII